MYSESYYILLKERWNIKCILIILKKSSNNRGGPVDFRTIRCRLYSSMNFISAELGRIRFHKFVLAIVPCCIISSVFVADLKIIRVMLDMLRSVCKYNMLIRVMSRTINGIDGHVTYRYAFGVDFSVSHPSQPGLRGRPSLAHPRKFVVLGHHHRDAHHIYCLAILGLPTSWPLRHIPCSPFSLVEFAETSTQRRAASSSRFRTAFPIELTFTSSRSVS